jgi:hypothetical protein
MSRARKPHRLIAVTVSAVALACGLLAAGPAAAATSGLSLRGAPGAQLTLRPALTETVNGTTITYDLIENSGGLCLDANSNYYPDNGDPLQLWYCANTGEQLWYFSAPDNQILNYSGLCLDANSNDYPANGDPLQLWTCDSNPEQLWTQDGSDRIHNGTASGGECVDANSNDYNFIGDPIQLWSCNDNPEQRW